MQIKLICPDLNEISHEYSNRCYVLFLSQKLDLQKPTAIKRETLRSVESHSSRPKVHSGSECKYARFGGGEGFRSQRRSWD